MSNPTRWVGIDLHRRRSQIAMIDEHGGLTLQKRIPTGRETFTEALGEPDGTHVALEATYGWEWLAELLNDAGFDVHLAHPLRTRAIAAARVKTDAVDAKTLAHLLRTGMLAVARPPTDLGVGPDIDQDSKAVPLRLQHPPSAVGAAADGDTEHRLWVRHETRVTCAPPAARAAL